jgi:hypothetical protein
VLGGITFGAVQAATGGEGSAAATFLKLDPAARSTAVGSAYTARPTGALAGYFNPAGLADLERSEGLFTRFDLTQGISYNYLGLARPTPGEGAVSLSVTSLDYGTQQRTEISGNNPVTGLGSVSASDMAVSAAYGSRLTKRFNVGVTLKYLQSKLASEQASTFSGDLGLQFQSDRYPGLRLGVAARNLFGSLTYQKASNPLPAVYDLGTAYHLNLMDGRDYVRFSGGYSLPEDADSYLKLGVEYALYRQFFGRLGYNGSAEVASGFRYGFGMETKRFQFDFAMAPMGELGNHQRLTVSYQF